MSPEQQLAFMRLFLGLAAFWGLLFIFRYFSLRSRLRDSSQALRWIGFERLEVVDVGQETPTIKSFILKREGGKVFPTFTPGQFVSVQIQNDPNVIRSYSISSSAHTREHLQIAVKLISNGLGSAWMHGLKKGDHILASAPAGHFCDDQTADDNLTRVYIAGGIGITPLFSMLHAHAQSGFRRPTYLFYGVREVSELAFHSQLLEWQKQYPNFKFICRISGEDSQSYLQGRLSYDVIQSELTDLLSSKYLICGPQAMADDITDALLNAGVSEDKIFFEKFISPVHLDSSKIPTRKAVIEVLNQKLIYEGTDNLLTFLESQGVMLPFACRSGVCGSCKCRVEGQITSLTDAGLTRAERKQNYVLACVSFPEGLVKVRVDTVT